MPHFATLQEAMSGLKTASGRLETQFLATASELEALTDQCHRFVGLVQNLVGLASVKNGQPAVFANAVRLIDKTTQFLSGCLEETERMLELLRDYDARMLPLLGVEADLQRAMKPLTFVQTLFKSEAAPLGAEVRQLFTSLTAQIESLNVQLKEIFGSKFADLKHTHDTISSVVEQLGRQSQSLRNMIADRRTSIAKTLETLRREMAENLERDARMTRLTADVSREVGRVVTGLQSQDIVNQKLDHVHSALPKIEAKLTEYQSAPRRGGSTDALHFVLQSCRLEAAQLGAARDDLKNAESGIQDGIRSFMGYLEETDTGSASLEDLTLLTRFFDTTVESLVETLVAVRGLIDVAVKTAADACEKLRPVRSLASDLTAIIRDLSADIHLVGLNARVQAAQVAQDERGLGLEVLAQETSQISAATNRISEEAAIQLDALSAKLAETVLAFEQLRTDGIARQALLEGEAAQEERDLREFRDRARQTLDEIGGVLGALRTKSEQALDHIQFGEFHGVTLPELQSHLTGVAGSVDRILKRNGSPSAPATMISEFESSYTMASERQVFAKLTEFADGAEEALQPALASQSPDPGSSVELF